MQAREYTFLLTLMVVSPPATFLFVPSRVLTAGCHLPFFNYELAQPAAI